MLSWSDNNRDDILFTSNNFTDIKILGPPVIFKIYKPFLRDVIDSG